jgi:hypothetical protein
MRLRRCTRRIELFEFHQFASRRSSQKSGKCNAIGAVAVELILLFFRFDDLRLRAITQNTMPLPAAPVINCEPATFPIIFLTLSGRQHWRHRNAIASGASIQVANCGPRDAGLAFMCEKIAFPTNMFLAGNKMGCIAPMWRITRATVARGNLGVSFKLYLYDYGSGAERIGIAAPESKGVEARRVLKTSMARSTANRHASSPRRIARSLRGCLRHVRIDGGAFVVWLNRIGSCASCAGVA